jgi:ABC-2 type transport system ATP-binding protein
MSAGLFSVRAPIIGPPHRFPMIVSTRSSPGPAIQVQSLTKRYGDVLAVDDIDFVAQSGAIVGLLGGNGAGKTTTIAMLLGLLLPTSGAIRVLGHDMLRDRFAALARMNFSSPYVSLPQRLTVRENLRV